MSIKEIMSVAELFLQLTKESKSDNDDIIDDQNIVMEVLNTYASHIKDGIYNKIALHIKTNKLQNMKYIINLNIKLIPIKSRYDENSSQVFLENKTYKMNLTEEQAENDIVFFKSLKELYEPALKAILIREIPKHAKEREMKGLPKVSESIDFVEVY